jgi:putative flippase GtrA
MPGPSGTPVLPRAPRSRGPRARRLLELLKFGVAGGSTFALDLGLLVLLRQFTSLPLAVDAAAAFAVAAGVNFALTRHWVFATASAGQSASADLARYVLLVGAGLVLTAVTVPLLAAAGTDYRIAKLLASGLVAAVNYVLLPRWVFGASRRP